MKISVNVKSALISILFLISANSAFAELVIIVNTNNLSSLKKREIVNIYLDKTNEFPNGATAVPVSQPEESIVNIAFNKLFLKMDHNRLKRYWAKRSFSGRAKPPKVLKDDEEVIEFVSRNSSAIGYVDRASVGKNEDIRIVAFGN